MTQLGAALALPQRPKIARPDPSLLLVERLLDAVTELKTALDTLTVPAPEVRVEPPDLSAIVTAVTSLKPGVTADEIATAIAKTLNPHTPITGDTVVLGELAEALRKLDFRLQGTGTQAYGGGSVSLQSGHGLATETSLGALLAEFRNRYDAVTTATATYTAQQTNTVLVDPAAGQAVRCVWLYAQASNTITDQVEVTFTLGSNTYTFELSAAQAMGHSAVWEGAADQNLTVSTSAAKTVFVNSDYRTFTP